MRQQSDLVWSHLTNHPFAFIGIVFSGFLNSVISFLLPVSVGEFFSIHYQSDGSKAKLLKVLGIHLHTMNSFLLFFAVLLLLKPILNYIETLGISWHGEVFVKKIRESVFDSQMNWEAARFEKGGYGKYLLRYSNDMKAIQNYLTKGILGGIKNILFIMTGFMVLGVINVKLTIILFSLLLVASVLVFYAAHYQKKFIRASRSKRSSLLAYVARKLSLFSSIKRDQKEQSVIQNFTKRSEELYVANMQYNKIESIIQSGSSFLIFLMVAILIWEMTMTPISSAHSVIFILVIMMMRSAFTQLLKLPGYLNKGKISLQKVEKLLINEPIDHRNVDVSVN